MRHLLTWHEQMMWRNRLEQLFALNLIEFIDENDRRHWRLSERGVRMLSGCIEADAPIKPRTQSRAEIAAELDLMGIKWRRRANT